MRRTATTILTLAAALSLGGCATIMGDPVQTEMLIANHPGAPVTVALQQASENAANPIAVEQTVAPDGSVRFSGKEGDAVVLTAGGQPALTLLFAKRSQTVTVSESRGQTSIDIYRGYRDPGK